MLEPNEYRKGVLAVIVNSRNQFLIAQSIKCKDDEWGFVSGGIEDRESLKEALFRELKEELGVEDFEIVAQSEELNKYDWPYPIVKDVFDRKGKLWKGQIQYPFLLKFLGNEGNFVLQKDELRRVKWAGYDELKSYLLFPNQFEDYDRIIRWFVRNNYLSL